MKQTVALPRVVVSIAVDPIATAARRTAFERPVPLHGCDVCGEAVAEGEASSGLLLWFRGAEVRAEEPVLCPKCSTAIGMTALSIWAGEEEEG